MDNSAKLLIVGCLAAVLLGTVGVFAACGGLMWFAGSTDAQNVRVSVDAPPAVRRGEPFQIVARVTNTDTSKQTLVDIDLSAGYLDGITIVSSNPPYSESEEIFGDMSYSYDLPIGPGETREVVFDAVAAQSGTYVGEFDFCIDTAYSFKSQTLRTTVTE